MTADRIADRYTARLALSHDQAYRGLIPQLAWNLGDGNALEELRSAANDWRQIAGGDPNPETVNRRRDAATMALSRLKQYLNDPDRRHEYSRLTEAIYQTEDELAALNAIIGQN